MVSDEEVRRAVVVKHARVPQSDAEDDNDGGGTRP